jgi:hypothetical protein
LQKENHALIITKNDRIGLFVGVSVLVILVLYILVGLVGTSTPVAPTCKSDWTKCADNRDMANNFDGWFHVQYGCKTAATDRAKYGTPEWPSFFFSSFYPGTNFSTGIVTLIEPDAKFQNGFGAMVHSRVQCEFDLRADKVINVTIGQR